MPDLTLSARLFIWLLPPFRLVRLGVAPLRAPA